MRRISCVRRASGKYSINRSDNLKPKRYLKWTLELAVSCFMLLQASCAKADSVANYEPLDKSNLTPMGIWGTSGKLMFRLMKVEETRVLKEGEGQEKAPRGMRFVVVNLDVMPYDQGKGTVDIPRSVSLVDASGLAYKPSSERFTKLNTGLPEFRIDAGQFAERIVAFLVPKDYRPLALRCAGADDAKPCLLALRVEEK